MLDVTVDIIKIINHVLPLLLKGLVALAAHAAFVRVIAIIIVSFEALYLVHRHLHYHQISCFKLHFDPCSVITVKI